jgi:tetratricopeptide (TPR) repeat protein
MSQGPGGGGDSQDREDRPADAGPGNSANGPGGATDGQDSSANGQESRSGGRENGAYGQVNGADGRGSGAVGGGSGAEGRARGDGDGSDGGGRGGGSHGDGSGDTYDLYQRGLDLLSRGSAAAAAQLLARANTAEPGSRSVLEALARAQFDAHRYGDAADSFRQIVEASPADDYAQFGLGLALARTGNPRGAAEHLALAAAMRPDLRHYSDALRGVRATLRARREAGLPDQISPGERGQAPGSGPGPGPPPGQPGSGPGLTGTGAA